MTERLAIDLWQMPGAILHAPQSQAEALLNQRGPSPIGKCWHCGYYGRLPLDTCPQCGEAQGAEALAQTLPADRLAALAYWDLGVKAEPGYPLAHTPRSAPPQAASPTSPYDALVANLRAEAKSRQAIPLPHTLRASDRLSSSDCQRGNATSVRGHAHLTKDRPSCKEFISLWGIREAHEIAERNLESRLAKRGSWTSSEIAVWNFGSKLAKMPEGNRGPTLDRTAAGYGWQPGDYGKGIRFPDGTVHEWKVKPLFAMNPDSTFDLERWEGMPTHMRYMDIHKISPPQGTEFYHIWPDGRRKDIWGSHQSSSEDSPYRESHKVAAVEVHELYPGEAVFPESHHETLQGQLPFIWGPKGIVFGKRGQFHEEMWDDLGVNSLTTRRLGLMNHGWVSSDGTIDSSVALPMQHKMLVDKHLGQQLRPARNWYLGSTKEAAWSREYPERQRAMFAEPDYKKYRDLLVRYPHELEPGAHIWRGEVRGEDPQDIQSAGIHWTVNPDAVISPKAWDDQINRNIIWHARLDDPATQAIPRSHPIWQGRSRSLDWEGEVRMNPGANVNLLGAYVYNGNHAEDPMDQKVFAPNYPERMGPGWSYVPLDKSVRAEHKPLGNRIDYSMWNFSKVASGEPTHYNPWTGLPCGCNWGRPKKRHRTASQAMRQIRKQNQKVFRSEEGQKFLDHLEQHATNYPALEPMVPWLASRYKHGDVYVGTPEYAREGDDEDLLVKSGSYMNHPLTRHIPSWTQWMQARQHPTRRGVNIMSLSPREVSAKADELQRALDAKREDENWLHNWGPTGTPVHYFSPHDALDPDDEYEQDLLNRYKGWHVSQITNPEELAGESSKLGHCIGNEDQPYRDALENDQITVHSLRNPAGVPQVSWHHNPDGTLAHVQGKGGYPKQEWRDLISMFHNANGLDDDEGGEGYEQGLEPAYDRHVALDGPTDHEEYDRQYGPDSSPWDLATDMGYNVGEETEFEQGAPDWEDIYEGLKQPHVNHEARQHFYNSVLAQGRRADPWNQNAIGIAGHPDEFHKEVQAYSQLAPEDREPMDDVIHHEWNQALNRSYNENGEFEHPRWEYDWSRQPAAHWTTAWDRMNQPFPGFNQTVPNFQTRPEWGQFTTPRSPFASAWKFKSAVWRFPKSAGGFSQGDLFTCNTCGSHALTEPRQVGGKWVQTCTNCNRTRVVDPTHPYMNSLQRQTPYPNELAELNVGRPMNFFGKEAAGLADIVPYEAAKAIVLNNGKHMAFRPSDTVKTHTDYALGQGIDPAKIAAYITMLEDGGLVIDTDKDYEHWRPSLFNSYQKMMLNKGWGGVYNAGGGVTTRGYQAGWKLADDGHTICPRCGQPGMSEAYGVCRNCGYTIPYDGHELYEGHDQQGWTNEQTKFNEWTFPPFHPVAEGWGPRRFGGMWDLVWPKVPAAPTPEQAAQGKMCYFHPDRPAVKAEGFAPMCVDCAARYDKMKSQNVVWQH